MSSCSLQDNADLQSFEQNYGDDPLADRESDLHRREFVMGFIDKWDELIDWDARAKPEGQFFIDVLRARGKESVLDAATGTGFPSDRMAEAGFDVISVDGSAAMLAKAFENGRNRGLILKTVQADWRELNRGIHGKYDATICLGNSFTDLHDEQDRRKALAEFDAALTRRIGNPSLSGVKSGFPAIAEPPPNHDHFPHDHPVVQTAAFRREFCDNGFAVVNPVKRG